MTEGLENMESILDRQISGFHRLRLSAPVQLTYASENLYRMLMAEPGSLVGEGDPYLGFVHPADRDRYREFLAQLPGGQGSGTVQYRLVRTDGEILSVTDTVHTDLDEDGVLMGSSVLTDVTFLQEELRDLRFLSQTIPCGFLKYTCEKQPRITYVNDRMLSILDFPKDREERQELWELYRDNLYTLIPVEERRRFAAYLDRVQRSGTPLAGELTVLSCDGSKTRLFGWVTKSLGDGGQEEFQSVCMDISEKYHNQKNAEVGRYLSALHDVYDKIFEYNFTANTVTCVYGQKSGTFRTLENIPMQMQEATEHWVRDTVLPEDRETVLDFFRTFFQHRQNQGQPRQIRYRARSSDGRWKNYLGLFLEIDGSVSLYCCRELARASAALESENASLKSINENMQELMMHFTDGLAAFELSGDFVTPLYASDNVCGFFGYDREEWMELMKRKTPIPEFIRGSGIPYGEFARILTQGEAEFTYPDLSTGLTRRIKAVCSQKNPGGSSPRYVMLYDLDAAPQAEGPRVYIRTFGFFDVFVDDKPIAFRIQKAKELFALLVDRRGGYITSDEAISYLWPEEPSSPVTLSRYRKVALRLKSILEEYGIPQVVEAVDGKRRLAADLVQCDLYDYLSGRPEHAQLFKGSYLSNYSWGETTLGELTCENLY